LSSMQYLVKSSFSEIESLFSTLTNRWSPIPSRLRYTAYRF